MTHRSPTPSTCSALPRGRSNEGGFTLLEVMLAFAILAGAVGILTQIWAANIEKAIGAIDQREMRELADTVFGKILFEQQKNRDGDEGSMDVTYGEWAGLPQARADRYRNYRYTLSKKEYVAAGSSGTEDDAEDLFASEDDEADTATAEGENANQGSIKLIKFTLKVFRTDTPGEALITLSRYLRPPDLTGAR